MKRKITRRDFGKAALAGIPLVSIALKSKSAFAAAKPNSKIHGVQLGAQTYSFRDLKTIDEVLTALTTVGLSSCELFSPCIEPGGAPAALQRSPDAAERREDLRKWRLSTAASYFEDVRKKFNGAGVEIYSYNISFSADFTDDEINKGFDQARALGARFINSSSSITVARRVAPFADKQQFRVAWHGHSSKDPDQFASTDSFLTGFGLSKYFWANLDIGHYTAWGGDPIQFLKDHHDRIDNIHLKDRKKNDGANVEWGEGDTKICDVLELIKNEKWPIPAFVEYEYPGKGTSTEEVAKCYGFAKKCLGA